MIPPSFTPAMVLSLLPALSLLVLAGVVLLLAPFLRPWRVDGTGGRRRLGNPDGRRPAGHPGDGAGLRPSGSPAAGLRRDDALRHGVVRLRRGLPLRRRRHGPAVGRRRRGGGPGRVLLPDRRGHARPVPDGRRPDRKSTHL